MPWIRILLSGLWLLGSAALVLPGTSLGADFPQPPNGRQPTARPIPSGIDVEEIEVEGARVGPQMWRLSKSSHVVWILGTLSPLPRRFVWDTSAVEAVLDQAQELIPDQPGIGVSIGPITAVRLYLQWRKTRANPNRATLRETLPPPLYQRFAALEQRFDAGSHKLEEFRPLVAGVRLFDKALDASGLSRRDGLSQTVTKIARKKGVRIRQSTLKIDDPVGVLKDLDQIPPAAEDACLETIMQRVESDLGTMQRRALAWSIGDVALLRQLPYPDERITCAEALSNVAKFRALIAQVQADWVRAVEEAASRNTATLALQPMDQLLGSTGILAILRAKGYTITGP